ncbi:MAG TPA: CBS domain-containing protein, partial [Clostridia bacterium]|nr:CBS domain-containing protein [Clostridia bacterium]
MAAISYASLKRELGEPDALAVRLGSIGAETSFVLERFGFHQPVLLQSARTQLKDIHFDLPKTVLPTVTIREAWETMLSNKLRSLPVVGEEGQLLGICTSSDIVDFEMASSDKN